MDIEKIYCRSGITMREMEKFCDKAREEHIQSVSVAPYYVSLASNLLKDSSITVGTLISASHTMGVKSYEAIDAIQNGASSITLEINMGMVKDHLYEDLQDEIEEIRDAIDGHDLKIKISNIEKEEMLKVITICNETFIHDLVYEMPKLNRELIELCINHKSEILNLQINGQFSEEEMIWLQELGVSCVGMEELE